MTPASTVALPLCRKPSRVVARGPPSPHHPPSPSLGTFRPAQQPALTNASPRAVAEHTIRTALLQPSCHLRSPRATTKTMHNASGCTPSLQLSAATEPRNAGWQAACHRAKDSDHAAAPPRLVSGNIEAQKTQGHRTAVAARAAVIASSAITIAGDLPGHTAAGSDERKAVAAMRMIMAVLTTRTIIETCVVSGANSPHRPCA